MTPEYGWRLIVNFHGIGDPWPGVPEEELPFWCSAKNWPVIADELAVLTERTGVPLEITFDDGNSSDFELALPVLLDRGLTATFFPCAGRIDRVHFLSRDQLVGLRDAGMAIGSHGWSHIDLRKVAAETLEKEAHESRTVLAQASGGPVDSFAIPFGSYDRRVLGALRSYLTVYSSDRSLVKRRPWPTPRHSYTIDWTPGTVLRLAQERPKLPTRMRRAAVLTLKRLR